MEERIAALEAQVAQQGFIITALALQIQELKHTRLSFDDIEEEEPDEWDLEMLARIEARTERVYIPLEECCRILGVDLDEIQNISRKVGS